MNSKMIFEKILDKLEWGLYLFVSSILFLLLLVTILGTLPIVAPWVEEICVLLFGWVIFIGAGVIMRRHGHVAITAFLNYLPDKVKVMVYIFNHVLILIMSLVIVYYGIIVTLFAGSRQTSLYLAIPFSYYYSAIPIGGTILTIFCIEALFKYKIGLQTIMTVAPQDSI